MLDHVDKEVLPDISTAIHGCIPLFDLDNEEEQIPGIASIFENHTLVKIPRCDAAYLCVCMGIFMSCLHFQCRRARFVLTISTGIV